MTDHQIPQAPEKSGETTASAPVNRTRRRLSGAALATPVIATLAARPAMACSVSGFISGNTSPGRQSPSCEGYGCTPGFWKNAPWVWKRVTPYSGGYCSDPTKVTNCNGQSTWVIGGTTLNEILPQKCSNPFGFAGSTYMMDIFLKGVKGDVVTEYADVCHYMAAILNAAASPAYGTTVLEIQDGLCKAYESGQVNYYTTVLLARLNQRGCMFNHHGACERNFVKNETEQCIPACPEGSEFNTETMRCE